MKVSLNILRYKERPEDASLPSDKAKRINIGDIKRHLKLQQWKQISMFNRLI